MKDQKDKNTLDAFSAKKRGRPSTGNALTPAQRKKLQRERDASVISVLAESDSKRDFKLITLTSLLEHLGRYVTSGDHALVRAISNELIRRSKLAPK